MSSLSGPQIALIGMVAVFFVLTCMMLLAVSLRLIFGEKAAEGEVLSGTGGKRDHDTSCVEPEFNDPGKDPVFDKRLPIILTAAVKAYQKAEKAG